MSESSTSMEQLPVWRYVHDGIGLAAILLAWGLIGVTVESSLHSIGGAGGLFETIGPQVRNVLVITGLLNALLFLFYRTVDYWHNYT